MTDDERIVREFIRSRVGGEREGRKEVGKGQGDQRGRGIGLAVGCG